jgi:hypothetical protein
MGFFMSADEKQLDELCRGVGSAAASIVKGSVPESYLADLVDARAGSIGELYDRIASSEGSKKAKRATRVTKMPSRTY